MLTLLLALALQGTDRAVQPQSVHRGIAIDERLAASRVRDVGVAVHCSDSDDFKRIERTCERERDGIVDAGIRVDEEGRGHYWYTNALS